MGDIKEARRIRRNYHRRIEWRRIKGLVKSDYALQFEGVMLAAEMHNKLWQLGYRVDEVTGRLVEVTQEYIDAEKAKETETDRLCAVARRTNDPEDIRRLISHMAKEISDGDLSV